VAVFKTNSDMLLKIRLTDHNKQKIDFTYYVKHYLYVYILCCTMLRRSFG